MASWNDFIELFMRECTKLHDNGKSFVLQYAMTDNGTYATNFVR